MPTYPITADKIDARRTIRACDPESFDLMVETLQKLRYRISEVRSKMHDLVPAYEKVRWVPGDRNIFGHQRGGVCKVLAQVLVHESIHALATRKYGEGTRGRPMYILLIEALASSANVYFDISYIATFGYTKRTLALVNRYGSYAKPADAHLIKNLNRAIAARYETFRETAIDMFEVYKILFEQLRHPPGNVSSVYRFMKKRKNLVFMLQFDIGNNVLFAKTNCGLNSTREDLKICAEIIQNLEKSQSFYEFLKTLC